MLVQNGLNFGNLYDTPYLYIINNKISVNQGKFDRRTLILQHFTNKMNLKSYVSSIDLIRKMIIFSSGIIYIILAYL